MRLPFSVARRCACPSRSQALNPTPPLSSAPSALFNFFTCHANLLNSSLTDFTLHSSQAYISSIHQNASPIPPRKSQFPLQGSKRQLHPSSIRLNSSNLGSSKSQLKSSKPFDRQPTNRVHVNWPTTLLTIIQSTLEKRAWHAFGTFFQFAMCNKSLCGTSLTEKDRTILLPPLFSTSISTRSP